MERLITTFRDAREKLNVSPRFVARHSGYKIATVIGWYEGKPVHEAVRADLFQAIDADHLESMRSSGLQYANADLRQLAAWQLFLLGKYRGHRAPRSGKVVNASGAVRSRPSMGWRMQLVSNGDGTARFIHRVEK